MSLYHKVNDALVKRGIDVLQTAKYSMLAFAILGIISPMSILMMTIQSAEYGGVGSVAAHAAIAAFVVAVASFSTYIGWAAISALLKDQPPLYTPVMSRNPIFTFLLLYWFGYAIMCLYNAVSGVSDMAYLNCLSAMGWVGFIFVNQLVGECYLPVKEEAK